MLHMPPETRRTPNPTSLSCNLEDSILDVGEGLMEVVIDYLEI